MSYVRKRLLMLSLLAVLTCGARAQGVPFFFPSLSVVYADPGFGIGYRTAGDGVEESHYGAYGKGRYGRVHGAFAYEYAELDSLYRRNYWNLSSSFLWTYFGARGGYGVSVEWIPSVAFWTRHRYEAGLLARYGGVAVDFGVEGYTDDSPELVGSFFWSPSDGFRVYAGATHDGARLGYSLSFSHVRIDFAGRVPGFAVSLGLNFGWNGWNIGGNRWFGGDDLDWSAFWAIKNLKK